MNIIEKDDGWDFIFSDGDVRLLKIDFRIEFMFVDGDQTVSLCLETGFSVSHDGKKYDCVPEDPITLYPALIFVNQKVNSIRIHSSGNLSVIFDADSLIEIRPDPSYEAWQLGAPPDYLMVCPPEGQVVVFET